jgi:hypothetical protein
MVVLYSSFCYGQISFFNYYSDNGADFGEGIVQLEDSSYVLTGASSSFGNAPSQAFLMQIDSLGNYMWSKSYGGPESESGRRVLHKPNFGYFICGYTNSYGAGGFDFYLAKVDESANLEWENTYGGTGWERVNDAALTRDTGTLLVGETSSNETDNLDIYIVRTNKFGDTLWTKTLGGSGDDKANCILKYTDSTYFIGGEYYVEDSVHTKGYMMYLKDDGTVFWERTFGPNGDYWINELVVDVNPDKIVGIGGANGPLTNDTDGYICLMHKNGSFWGGFHPPTPGEMYFTEATSFGDNDDFYISAVFNNDAGYQFGEDISISKYSSSFAFQSSFGISHDYPDYTGDIIRTSDGGAIVIGHSTAVVSGGNEITVAKIGPGDIYPDNINGAVISNLVLIDELDLSSLVTLFPNPSTGNVTLVSETDLYTYYRLIDSRGKVLKAGDFYKVLNLSLSQEGSGMYFMELKGSTVVPVRIKIMIQ